MDTIDCSKNNLKENYNCEVVTMKSVPKNLQTDPMRQQPPYARKMFGTFNISQLLKKGYDGYITR